MFPKFSIGDLSSERRVMSSRCVCPSCSGYRCSIGGGGEGGRGGGGGEKMVAFPFSSFFSFKTRALITVFLSLSHSD